MAVALRRRCALPHRSRWSRVRSRGAPLSRLGLGLQRLGDAAQLRGAHVAGGQHAVLHLGGPHLVAQHRQDQAGRARHQEAGRRPARALADRRALGHAVGRALLLHGVADQREFLLAALREREQAAQAGLDAVVVGAQQAVDQRVAQARHRQQRAGVAAPLEERERRQLLQRADDLAVGDVAHQRGAGGVVGVAHEGGQRQPVDALDQRPVDLVVGREHGPALGQPAHQALGERGAPQRDRRGGQVVELGVGHRGQPHRHAQRHAEQFDRVLRISSRHLHQAFDQFLVERLLVARALWQHLSVSSVFPSQCLASSKWTRRRPSVVIDHHTLDSMACLLA